MSSSVLVTGPTGNVGREVVAVLRERGAEVRAGHHRPTDVRARFGEAVPVVRLDLRDPSTWAAATRGCSSLFLLQPPAIADTKRTLVPFIDVAREQGVGHVVFLSVAGAGENKIVPHHAVEAHLRARGPDHTLLRPGFFAQNLQDAYLRDIVEDDRIYVPAGRGRVTFVDLRDVAEVAALALLQPAAHREQAYTLTGPEAIGFAQVAELLTGAVGRTVRYEPASMLGYVRHLRRRALPWGQAVVQTILHVGLRLGQAEAIDPTLASLLGRPGRTLGEYVRDHAALWAAGERAGRPVAP
jgi:uncharacterized protein YbjT (DUF2867 family)